MTPGLSNKNTTGVSGTNWNHVVSFLVYPGYTHVSATHTISPGLAFTAGNRKWNLDATISVCSNKTFLPENVFN